jgi:tetratricopeptide (TPR) repeat protein
MSSSDQHPAAASIAEQLEMVTNDIGANDYDAALARLESIPDLQRTPSAMSAYALCNAELKGDFKKSVNICHEAIKREPKNSEHYFRQGRILLLAGRKKDAIWVLRMGLRHGRHRGIIELLGSLGIRRPPPIPLLPRSNPLNKYLGILLTRLNLR